ncbi:MAG: ABC transporter substrate-binding protein [Gammaproteobacteria bacterium]|nr:ABC transporter substrate-binding protein [Gammaproteobacteria bacterium]
MPRNQHTTTTRPGTGKFLLLALLLIGALWGCETPNNPYPAKLDDRNIRFTSFSERPKHLDPASAYVANEMDIIAQIYEPPLQYHYLKRPYQLTTLTAEAVPQPVALDQNLNPLPASTPVENIAYSRYRITIKPGIRFQPHPAFARDETGAYRYHQLTAQTLEEIRNLDDFGASDSRELTAADYVHQIKRLAHPGIHSPLYGFMREFIVGLGDLGDTLRASPETPTLGELPGMTLSGVKIIDRYTYEITIHGSYPQFVYWLAMPFFAPVPVEADMFYSQPGLKEKNITLDWHPIGTGPYLLAVNDPNRRMLLKRNPEFRSEPYPDQGEPGDRASGLLEDAGKPMPFVDEVLFTLEKESIPIWNKFLQGYYDISGISSDSFDQVIDFGPAGDITLSQEIRDKGIRLQSTIAPSTVYIGFNMLDPVVGGDNQRARLLRHAIGIVIDQEESIAIFRNGRGIVMQGPLPPGLFGYRDGEAGLNPYLYDWVDGKPRRKSVEEAGHLMSEAGYPEGIDPATGEPLLLYFDTSASGPQAKAYLDWLRKQLRKIGVQLVIRSTDFNRFQDKVRKGKAQMFQWGWNADYPDPENFLFLFYGPNSRALHGGENTNNYQNPEFDALFEQMRNMPNGLQRQALIDQMVGYLQRDLPWASGFHPKDLVLYHGWNYNTKTHSMANNTVKYQRIDPELRLTQRRAWNQPKWWPVVLILGALLASIIPAFLAYRRRQSSPAL